MGWPIVARQPGAIHAQRHVEILQRDIMNQHVVSALHEGRVDGEERLETLRGEAASKKRCMFLRDADIKVLIWVIGGKVKQASTRWHRCGNRHDLLVVVSELGKSLTQKCRVSRRRRLCGLTGLERELAEPVKFVRLRQRRRIPFPFLGNNVEQNRLLLALQKLEGTDQEGDIVPVYWSVIVQTKILKNNARQKEVLHTFFYLMGKLLCKFASNHFHELGRFLVQMTVGVVGYDPI